MHAALLTCLTFLTFYNCKSLNVCSRFPRVFPHFKNGVVKVPMSFLSGDVSVSAHGVWVSTVFAEVLLNCKTRDVLILTPIYLPSR